MLFILLISLAYSDDSNFSEKEVLELRLNLNLQEVESAMSNLCQEDWKQWFSWKPRKKWIQENGLWHEVVIPSSSRIESFVLALRMYKKTLEEVLSYPPAKNALDRTEILSFIDAFYSAEISAEIKAKFFFEDNFSSSEQLQILYSYFINENDTQDASSFAVFFEKIASQSFSSEHGFSIIEKIQLIKRYFSLIEMIYENYLTNYLWPDRNDFMLLGDNLDGLKLSSQVYEEELSWILDYYPQFSSELAPSGLLLSLSSAAKLEIEKRIKSDVSTKEITPCLLQMAKLLTYEFLIRNKITALGLLSEFQENPAAAVNLLQFPKEIQNEFRDKMLILPKFNVGVGEDQYHKASQFFFSKRYF
ncbi:MAG: hypothetical protein HYS98_03685 [Deltaproteobacteria bacterium]|nr:hypothetical protein [Deltaproteobacteria bacterium]